MGECLVCGTWRIHHDLLCRSSSSACGTACRARSWWRNIGHQCQYRLAPLFSERTHLLYSVFHGFSRGSMRFKGRYVLHALSTFLPRLAVPRQRFSMSRFTTTFITPVEDGSICDVSWTTRC